VHTLEWKSQRGGACTHSWHEIHTLCRVVCTIWPVSPLCLSLTLSLPLCVSLGCGQAEKDVKRRRDSKRDKEEKRRKRKQRSKRDKVHRPGATPVLVGVSPLPQDYTYCCPALPLSVLPMYHGPALLYSTVLSAVRCCSLR